MDRDSQEHRFGPATSAVVQSSVHVAMMPTREFGQGEAGAQQNINGNDCVVTNNASNEISANIHRPSPLQTIQDAISEMLKNIRHSGADKNSPLPPIVGATREPTVAVSSGTNVVTQNQKDGGNGNNNCGNSIDSATAQGGEKTTEKGAINPGGKIKRPMNAFMVWAREYRNVLARGFPEDSNSQISVRLGDIWSNLSNDEKKPFYDKADTLRRQHEKDYPDWVYQPNKKKRTNGSPPNQPQYAAANTMAPGQTNGVGNTKNVKILPNPYPQPRVPQVMMAPPNHMYMAAPNCQPTMRHQIPGPDTPRPVPQQQGFPHQPARPMYQAPMAPQMPAMQPMVAMPTSGAPNYQYYAPYQHPGIPSIPMKETGPYYASPKRQARSSNMPEASPLAADKFQSLLTQHPLNDVIGKLSPDPKKGDAPQRKKKIHPTSKPKPHHKRTKKHSPRSPKSRKTQSNGAQAVPTSYVSPSWSYMGSPYGSIPTVMYSPYPTAATNMQARPNFSTHVMQNSPSFLQFSAPQTFVSPNQGGFVGPQNMASPMGSVVSPAVPMVSPYLPNRRPDYSLPPPPLMLPSQPGVMMYSPQPVHRAPMAHETTHDKAPKAGPPSLQLCKSNGENINYNNNLTNAGNANSTGNNGERIGYSQTQQNAPVVNNMKSVSDGSQMYEGKGSIMNMAGPMQHAAGQAPQPPGMDVNGMRDVSSGGSGNQSNDWKFAMNFYHSRELTGTNREGIRNTASTTPQAARASFQETTTPPNPPHHHQASPVQVGYAKNPPMNDNPPFKREDYSNPMQTEKSQRPEDNCVQSTTGPYQPTPVQNTPNLNNVSQKAPGNVTQREFAKVQNDDFFAAAMHSHPNPDPTAVTACIPEKPAVVGTKRAGAGIQRFAGEHQHPATQGHVQDNIPVDLSQQEFILIGDTYYQVVRQLPSDTVQNSMMIGPQQNPGNAGTQGQNTHVVEQHNQNAVQGNSDANIQQIQDVDHVRDQTRNVQNNGGFCVPRQHQHSTEQPPQGATGSSTLRGMRKDDDRQLRESDQTDFQGSRQASLDPYHLGQEQSMSVGTGTSTGDIISEMAPLPRKKSFLQTLQAPISTSEAADQLTRLMHLPAKPDTATKQAPSPMISCTTDATHISPAEYIATAMVESDIQPDMDEETHVVERSASIDHERAFQKEMEVEQNYATLDQNQVFVLSEPVRETASVMNEDSGPTYAELSNCQPMFATALQRPHNEGSSGETRVTLNRSYSPDLTDKNGVPEKMFQTPPGSSEKSGSEESTPREAGQRPIDLSIVSADPDSSGMSQTEGKLPDKCSTYLIDLESKEILVRTAGWDVKKCGQVSQGENLGDQKALVQVKRAHESLVKQQQERGEN